jgi:hypothetical protein
MSNKIPSYLLTDRYWAPLLHLFQKNEKLNSVFNTLYFDLELLEIRVQKLKRTAAPWSYSEKVMLNLALHLFNERNKFNLSDLDCLDDNNKKLAFEAMSIRFRFGRVQI